jgi:undecaprenyl-diphosphatase
MSIIEAIILGIIQGLSEFIPISSTAHLTIAGKMMGLIGAGNAEHWTAFIATIQLGTLVAVLFYFAKELREIPVAFVKENFTKNRNRLDKQTLNSRLGWMIIIATIPIVVVGLVLKKVIEGGITKDLSIIGFSLIGLAIILAIAERTAKFRKEMENITWKDALLVGLAQCLALIPGASRSGTTITAGLFLGIKRDTAAKFSFLISIPAILASGVLEFVQSLKYIDNADMLNLVVATLAAAISGYFSVVFLIKYLKTKSTMLFVVYRILLGIFILYAVYSKLIN